MKTLLFLSIFFACCHLTHAEKKVSEYYSSAFNKTYQIQASKVKHGKFKFYIYCKSGDQHTIGFILNSTDVPEFVASLDAVKEKFIEWSTTAHENQVTKYFKYFDIKFKGTTVFFKYGNDWHFSRIGRLNPYFLVTEAHDCFIVFDSGKVIASDNRYMDVQGFSLIFSSVDEVDDFIKAIDVKSVLQMNDQHSKVDELFN